MIMLHFILWSSCLMQFSGLFSEGSLQLNENKLDGLTIGLDNDMSDAENLRIIKKLVVLLKKTSQSLYEATFNRIYLGNVNIVIPKDSNASIYLQDYNIHSLANDSIDIQLTSFANGRELPFTYQGGRCQTPGLKIDFPIYNASDFDPEDQSLSKSLTKEILKLRYGVYDESGYDDNQWEPYVFYDPILNKTRITGCTDSEAINGTWIMNSTNDTCEPMIGNDECRLDIHNINAKFSVFFVTDVADVTEVCSNETHDYVSPTPQNHICGQSIFDVMLQHEDFKDDLTNCPGEIIQIPDPTIKILKKNNTSLYVLIDLSAGNSSDEQKKVDVNRVLDSLKIELPKALTGYPESSSVIITTFYGLKENKVTKTYNSQDVTSETLTDFLDDMAANDADMNEAEDALFQALLYLEEEDTVQYYNILLIQMVNSFNNVTTLLDIAALQRRNQYIKISAVIFGSYQNNPWIEKVTSESGGYLYLRQEYFPAVSTAAIDKLTGFDEERLLVYSDSMSISYSVSLWIQIDDTIGENTTFKATCIEINNCWEIEPKLMLNDTEFNTTAIDIATDFLVTIENANAGLYEWVFIKNSTDPYEVLISVTSQRQSMKNQIMIDAWTSSYEELHDLNKDPLAFYVMLTISGRPIISQNKVFLKLYSSKDTKDNFAMIQLVDDGKRDPDWLSNDGVYSAYLLNTSAIAEDVDSFTIHGDVIVYNDPDKQQDEENFDNLIIQKMNFRDQAISSSGNFDRVKMAALSQRITGANGYDPPPGRIIDLTATNVEENDVYSDSVTVYLNWTAPGGDLSNGTADSYDLRYLSNIDLATNNNQMMNQFSSWNQVSENQIIKGNLLATAKGNNDSVVISLPKYFTQVQYYVAIRAIDASKNKGEVSPRVVIAAAPKQRRIQKNIDQGGFVAVIVLSCLVVVAILALAVFILHKKKVLPRANKFRRKSNNKAESQDPIRRDSDFS